MDRSLSLRASAVFCGLLVSAACATVEKPCSKGGDTPWEAPLKSPGGTRQCFQRKDASGKWQNEGKYIEWYPDGMRAIQGEYKWGKKDGKWERWDEDGKRVSEEWWDDGVKLQGRTGKPVGEPTSPAPR